MQTIKMTNRQAHEMLTLIERTIAMIELQIKGDTHYYEQIKSIESAIHESCPELVDKWRNLKALIKSAAEAGVDVEGSFRQAVDEFNKWIDANE